jgi:hypothetical protein
MNRADALVANAQAEYDIVRSEDGGKKLSKDKEKSRSFFSLNKVCWS